MLDPIRDIFAALPESVAAGFTRNHFSFLNKQGQCPHCEGHGFTRTSMDFLPDVVSVCEHCRGARYAKEVLKVCFQQKNIAEILDLTIAEAEEFFVDHPKISEKLKILTQTGLGYVKTGQPLPTLSGGEAQRLQLAAELMKPVKGPSLYLFDEPSTGLHFNDIRQLLSAFDALVTRGHSLLVIEHNPEIIASAGYVIELGPEGGDAGGFLVGAGK